LSDLCEMIAGPIGGPMLSIQSLLTSNRQVF